MTPEPADPARNSFLRGFGFAMVLNLIQIPLAVMTMGIALFVVGLTQLFYVIPIAWKAYKRHETARLQGIVLAAGITILINGICDANFKIGH